MKQFAFLEEMPDTLRSFIAGATILNARLGRMKNWIVMMRHPRLGNCVLNFGRGMARIELEGESHFLQQYEGRLPVPRVLDQGDEDETSYLVTSMIEGEPLHLLIAHIPGEKIIEIAGQALGMIASAPLMPGIGSGVDRELGAIRMMIDQGKIDAEGFRAATGKSPAGILDQLQEEKRDHSDTLLTHGDFCIPNLIIHRGNLNGIIDWGKSGSGDLYRDLAAMEGSLLRNLGYPAMEQFFAVLGLDYDEYSREKIDFYKKMDQFWYYSLA
jgi:aminoglycoside phosphotransferase